MHGRVFQVLLTLVFGWAAGHLIWWTYFASDADDYVVGGLLVTMRPPPEHLDKKNLYARYTFYLPQPAESAWIEVVAYDELRVHVNETKIGRAEEQTVSVIASIARHLQVGKNVIAIVTRQTTLAHKPELSVRGGYRIGDTNYTFDSTGEWRCQWFHERKADHWIANGFDDSDWELVQRREQRMISLQDRPPDALTTASDAKWIGPPALDATEATLRHEFDVPPGFQHAWLRVEALGPYRLAVSGQILEVSEDTLGTTRPVGKISQWVYDISPMLKSGRTSIALALNTRLPPPAVRLDVGIAGRDAPLTRISSDKNWQWRPGVAADWHLGGGGGWQPVQVLDGNLARPIGETVTRSVRDSIPLTIQWRHWLREVGFIALVVLATALATLLVDRIVFPLPRGEARGGLSPAALALVLPTMIALTAILIAYDPRVGWRETFRGGVVWLVLLSIPVQWLVLAGLRAVRGVRPPPPPPPGGAWWQRSSVVYALLAALIVVGGWQRAKDLAARPLSPDEVSMYRATQGTLQRGFPSVQIHPNIPPVYAATSELVYIGPAIAALFSDYDRVIIRAPSAVWGTITIFLIYFCTARLMGRWAGLAAAALYALSPYCIAMSNLGRYYSQLQVFGLLTVYHFYRCIAAEGPLDRRALWWTVVCFICMILSWEGSALLAVPMMLAAIVVRRDRIKTLLCDPHVYGGMVVIVLLIIAQGAHRGFVQTGRPLYGSGATDVAMTPMWRYPGLDVWYYVRSATWNRDQLLPTLGLCVAGLLMVKHAFRRPVRVIMLIFMGICLVQALVLPVTGKRYSYHLLPMWIMLTGAALVALSRAITTLRWRERFALRPYANAVAGVFFVAYIYLGCGLMNDMGDLSTWRSAGTDPGALNLPQQQPCTEYVLQHMGPNDIVIVNAPHVIDHYLGRRSDYWVQTLMRLQACLDDERVIALHRLAGANALPDLGSLEDLFARYDTIWFIAEPLFNARTNVRDGNRFLRNQLECVYEDFSALVLVRKGNVPRALQETQEKTLQNSQLNLLP